MTAKKTKSKKKKRQTQKAEVPEFRNWQHAVDFYLKDTKTLFGKIIDIVLINLNVIYCLIYILEIQTADPTVKAFLWKLEILVVSVFTLEYFLRWYAAKNRFSYFTDIYSIVDLVAILPTVLIAFLPPTSVYVGFTKLLRIIRVLRILRFLRFTADNKFFFGEISKNLLNIMRLFLSILMLFFIGSILFWYVEGSQNPGLNTFSDAFYFIVVTLTTVGLGDITPVTQAGKWVSVGMILSGVLVIPWQVSQIAREWIVVSNRKSIKCKQCGLRYHDYDASHCKHCGAVIYQEVDGI